MITKTLGVIFILLGIIEVILSKSGLIKKFFKKFDNDSLKGEKISELATIEGMMDMSIGSLGIIFHSALLIIILFSIGFSIISYLYLKNTEV